MIAESAVVLGAALAFDILVGELPNALHPVVWMGTVARFLERKAPRHDRVAQLLAGGFIAIAVPGLFAALTIVTLDALTGAPAIVFAIFLLTSTFAIRGLGRAALDVRDRLRADDLPGARRALGSLCSRDASTLDGPLLVAASIESVAENASDSFVAPLFYYLLFGLPGAVAYRAINTLDAMIGYHGRYEYLGKASARLDDLANLVPARLTALLLIVAGALSGHDAREGWRILRRDAHTTESPNAGRPMAAMAGLLRVRLEKVGHYRLGDPDAPLTTATLDAAWRITMVCAALAASLAILGACLVRP